MDVQTRRELNLFHIIQKNKRWTNKSPARLNKSASYAWMPVKRLFLSTYGICKPKEFHHLKYKYICFSISIKQNTNRGARSYKFWNNEYFTVTFPTTQLMSKWKPVFLRSFNTKEAKGMLHNQSNVTSEKAWQLKYEDYNAAGLNK